MVFTKLLIAIPMNQTFYGKTKNYNKEVLIFCFEKTNNNSVLITNKFANVGYRPLAQSTCIEDILPLSNSPLNRIENANGFPRGET
jgi:hypothetical protein